MKKRFLLINRLHIRDTDGKNNFKSLGGYLKKKIAILEPTKGIIETQLVKKSLKDKLKKYNKFNNTDFSIE